MRLLSFLFFVGCFGCQQKQKNTTISQTTTEQKTPASFSTPFTTTTQEIQTNRLSVKPKTQPTSSYSFPETIVPQTQPGTLVPFNAEQFRQSVQQFVSVSRDEILNTETPEVFMLQPQQHTTIKTGRGTIISIHTSDLETTDGKPVTLPVKLLVKEMKDIGEMLKMHSPTVSNGDILETGGSWYISATSGGQELKMKDGKAYTLETTLRQDDKQGYSVFYGGTVQDGTVNWQITEGNLFTPARNEQRMPLPPGRMIYRPLITADLSYAPSGYMSVTPFTNSGEFVKNYIELNKNAYQAQSLDKLRKRNSYGIYKEDNDLKSDATIRQYINQAELSHFTYGDELWVVFLPKNNGNEFMVAMDTAVLSDDCKWLQKGTKRFIREKIARYEERVNAKAKLSIVSNRAMANLNGFGWINCDRFFQYAGTKIDYKVNISEASEDTPVVLYMVFKKIGALVNSTVTKDGSFAFTQVPEDEEVMLVAIGRSGKQNLYAQTGFYKLKKDQPVSLQLEKITTEEMTTRISKIQ